MGESEGLNMHKVPGSRSFLLAVAVVAVVYAVTLSLLPLGGIWINDIGSRVIQVLGIVGSHYSDYSLRYVGQPVDPGFHYAPITYPFAVVSHDRLYSVYSPLFALASAPFFRAFGYPGLYLIPPIASILMLVGLARLVGELGGGRGTKAFGILAAALATPVWFYSMTFWEHTLSVALCIWGIVALVRFLGAGSRRDLVLAAVLPAVGAWFRPDLYALLAAMFLMILWRSPRGRAVAATLFAGAAVAALVPSWIFQWATMGSPFGFHVGTLFSSTSGMAKHIAARPAIFYSLFARASSAVWLSLLLSAPFLVLLVVNPALPARRFGYALPVAGLVALAASSIVYKCFLGSTQVIACLGRSNSLFPAAPLLILGLLRCRDTSRPAPAETARRVVWQLALAYAVVYGLAAPEMSKWGIHWGNRYLLLLYPLFAALVAVNVADWRKAVAGKATEPAPRRSARAIAGAAVIVVVVAASLAAQLLSINTLDRKMDFSSRLNREIGGRPEAVVITDQWWLAQELYTQFYRKMIFLTTTQDQYRDLTERLAARGYTRALFVAPTVPGARLEPGTIQITDGGLGYWNLDLVPEDLGPLRH